MRIDELLMELENVTERWKEMLEELESKRQLPATYYLKFKEFAKYMGVGDRAAKTMAEEAKAKAWIGGVQMVNVIKVHAYLDSINE